MNAYLIGADRLGNIPQLLDRYGIRIAAHLTGRDASHQRKPTSARGADLIILFTDFMGHNVMRNYRQLATQNNIRFVACRRSVCDLEQSLAPMMEQAGVHPQ
ncbi:DUF2325 domain-containing protein [Silvimonas iriomotensis]|uniref:DUF2325 domain-containing protein n=1 Tax=Silvimonas iriomotensis TaxID=449662 RepID=A0ABQ2P850_9NEIS|nr:DUF2325 domain-containing protein [Silvimonas iriomotensis]GGP20341.1 hypothetical protein GCM10010970_14740 [Silvimonas iriomotensis]